MNNDDILDKCDVILSQPLITDEGFLNPACMNELENVLANFPETHERLRNDPEWGIPKITCIDEILSCFAHSAVEISRKRAFPPNLEKLLGYTYECLKRQFVKDAEDELELSQEWVKYSLCDINKLLWDILGDVPEFKEWNTSEVMGENWVDLSALLHNVCLHIRRKRREKKVSWDSFKKDNPQFQYND